MRRKLRSLAAAIATSLVVTQLSCATTLGTALRDAAIGGAAGFVEVATTDILNGWLGDFVEE